MSRIGHKKQGLRHALTPAESAALRDMRPDRGWRRIGETGRIHSLLRRWDAEGRPLPAPLLEACSEASALQEAVSGPVDQLPDHGPCQHLHPRAIRLRPRFLRIFCFIGHRLAIDPGEALAAVIRVEMGRV